MPRGSANIWYSADQDAFHRFANAQLEIQAKSPLELVQLQAELRRAEEDVEAAFGDGQMDYMMQRHGNLALINVNGNLVKSDSWYNRYYGQVSYQELRRAISMALTDNDTDGIVLMMNTPGGSASGADAMASFFSKANKVKPVYAYAETDMCSGGYYLAAPCTKIYGQRAASIGSIGVVMVHFSYLKMYKEAGIEPTVLRAGEYKALGTPYEELDKKSRAALDKSLDDYFVMFNEHVVANRKAFSSVDQFRASAGEGRVFLGEEAKEIGLVDAVADMEDALVSMSGLAARSRKSVTQFGYQSNTTTRTSSMKRNGEAQATLTAQQLAVLASGVALEGLEQEADASAPGAPEAEASAEPTVSAEAETGAAPAEAAPEASAPAASAEAPAAVDLSAVIALSSENGALKAKVEQLESSLQLADKRAEEALAVSTKLEGVAREACTRLQVALGYQPSDMSAMTGSQLAEQYAGLDASFKERYKPGQVSRPAADVPAATAGNGALQRSARNLTKNL